MKPAGVPLAVKTDLSARAQALVDSYTKPEHVKAPPSDPRYNYLVDISTKWHGRCFHFMSKYACPRPNAIPPFFEVGFARIEYHQGGRFGLAYMMHTGKWEQVHTNLDMDEALAAIREEPWFQP